MSETVVVNLVAALLELPEASMTAPAVTSKSSEPAVADDGVTTTVYSVGLFATAGDLIHPALDPEITKSLELKPVTGSSKVTVTVKVSTVTRFDGEIVTIGVGFVTSATAVVMDCVEPVDSPMTFDDFRR